MIFFGLLSSVTDFVFIYFILQTNPSPELFRTMWFLIASTEEILATFSIRTKKVFFRSKPSFTLIMISLLTITASVLITVIVFVPNIFGFVRLSLEQYGIVSIVVLLYIIPLEIAKLLFFRYLNKNKS
jgi:Mg2+-importing ATPase